MFEKIRKQNGLLITGFLTVSLIILFLIQFSQPLIIGADGFIHSRMAEIISKSGFIRSFPQAYFSFFNERFSDKDFVYHLYLIPFIHFFGLINGSKIAAGLMSWILCAVVCLISFKNLKTLPLIIAFTMFFTAPDFIRNILEPRPLVIAILLTVIGIDSLLEGRAKKLLLWSFTYGLCHISAWVLPAMAFIWGVFLWIKNYSGPFKLFLYSSLGFIVSFIVHPNFPNNIFFFILNGIMVPWYVLKGGVLELGAEFFPYTTSSLIWAYPGIIFGVICIVVAFLTVSFSVSKVITGWGLSAVFFGIMALISRRNVTHLYPVFIVFFSLLITNAGSHIIKFHQKIIKDKAISVTVSVFFIFVIFAVSNVLININKLFLGDRVYAGHFLKVAQMLSTYVPNGSIIFHTNWSDSQYLIGMAPNFRYIVTFDPIYMYAYDQGLYEIYRKISFGDTQNPVDDVVRYFNSYYGYAGKNYFSGFIKKLKEDKRVEIIYEDQLGIVYKINH